MGFWLVAVALSLVVSAFLASVLVRSEEDGDIRPNPDMHIYRDQLAEIERDVRRGILTKEEAIQIRVEIARRLLAADRVAQTDGSRAPPRLASAAIALLVCAMVICGSIGLYLAIGAPGYPDLPLAERIELAEELHNSRASQAEAETLTDREPKATDGADQTLLDLMERLRAAVAEHPDSLEGQELLARYEAILGNHTAAHSAQSRVIELKQPNAIADDYAALAQQMILAAGGFVSPEAEDALNKALVVDPDHGPARYYLGLMLAKSGRPDLAFGIWRALLEIGPPNAPWIPPIMAQIENVAQAAGLGYLAPSPDSTPLRDPTEEDIEAAEGMSAEDRQELIRGMVEGLANRIESGENTSPAEWARLIRSFGVLGETGRASEIWTRAQERFTDDPEAIETIRAEAAILGLTK